MAARSMWKGAITFGMVAVPVKLYLATESQSKVSFNMLCGECHERVNMKTSCATHGDIQRSATVKGFEYVKGQYVVVDEAELEAISLPSTKQIDISSFCPVTDDLGFVKQSYYLAPEAVGATAFDLLRSAMLERGVRAVAKITLRDRESLCVLEARGGGIVMSTLFWPDEVRNQADHLVPPKSAPPAASLEMGKQLIDALTETFDATQYEDLYRNAVLALVESKASGLVPTTLPTPVVEEDKTTDLDAVLRASLEANLAAMRARKADERKARKTA